MITILSLISYCIVLLFHKRKRDLAVKLDILKVFSGSISHELKTPLASIQLINNEQNKIFKKIVESSNSNLNPEIVSEEDILFLKKSIPSTKALLNKLFWILNFSNKNTNPSIDGGKFEISSINICVQTALENYPFEDYERELVKWDNSDDFVFWGNKVQVIHVIANLIKNALYAIKVADRGIISIRTESSAKWNKLVVMDTGTGIPEKTLSNVFNQIFSTKTSGIGLGLYFCKKIISNINGKICCQSKEGSYTTITLLFPKIQL